MGRFPFLQENRFKVLPRVCKTDFVQMPMAAASLAAGLFFWPGRSFTVLRTDLIQRQNDFAKR